MMNFGPQFGLKISGEGGGRAPLLGGGGARGPPELLPWIRHCESPVVYSHLRFWRLKVKAPKRAIGKREQSRIRNKVIIKNSILIILIHVIFLWISTYIESCLTWLNQQFAAYVHVGIVVVIVRPTSVRLLLLDLKTVKNSSESHRAMRRFYAVLACVLTARIFSVILLLHVCKQAMHSPFSLYIDNVLDCETTL